MELALNLAWVLLAAVLMIVWLRIPTRERANRRVQLVALALVIVVLLPVISVTDDLLAAQNPAEVDSYLRRDHDWATAHVVIPIAVAMVVSEVTSATGNAHRGFAQVAATSPRPALPALSSIDNRPPPAA